MSQCSELTQFGPSVTSYSATSAARSRSMTVISAVPCPLPALAVIVAAPTATPATRPDASTVAIATSLDSHENWTLSTASPFSSNPSAASCSVLPNPIVSADGDTSTEATGCITVTTADPDTLPALAVIVAIPSPAPVTRPDASTVATDVSLLLHVTVAPAITPAF